MSTQKADSPAVLLAIGVTVALGAMAIMNYYFSEDSTEKKPKQGGPPGATAGGAPPPNDWLAKPTPVQVLCSKLIDGLVAELKLVEVQNKSGEKPFRVMKGVGFLASEPEVLKCRVFKPTKQSPKNFSKLVFNELTLKAQSVHGFSVYAFASADSAAPHLVMDATMSWRPALGVFVNSITIDLLPRCDIGCEMSYLDEVYDAALTQARNGFAASHRAELTDNVYSRRFAALLSPFCFSCTMNEKTLQEASVLVNAFADRFVQVANKGVSAENMQALKHIDLRARDKKHRETLYNPSADPLWNMMDKMVGPAETKFLRDLLISQDMP